MWGIGRDLGNRQWPETVGETTRNRPDYLWSVRVLLLSSPPTPSHEFLYQSRFPMRYLRAVLLASLAVAVAWVMAPPALAQWPTTCVDLNDIVETHLGNDGNVGIYQRVFGDQAEQECQNDHRDDVRAVFAWAFDEEGDSAREDVPELPWPTDCVELNDIVEAHLGNDSNVEIYQRVFGDQAEMACRSDHRPDVRGVFAWAFGGAQFRAVDAGYNHSCGVLTDGTVTCWGWNDVGQAEPPPGTFQSISAGNGFTCGVRPDGSIACWGLNDFGEASPPAGAFALVSAGGLHACGLRTDGSVACWGLNNSGQASPPSGVFTSVSAGDAHTCGIRASGILACWGSDLYGQATPASGTFRSISAGDPQTCGIRTDDTLACWGLSPWNQAPGPAGTFKAVNTGRDFTCGVQSDGTVECWGRNEFGQSTPPSGVFQSVSSGAVHACGLRNRAITCWGSNTYGQATRAA